MVTQVPALRGAAFTYEISLISQADSALFQVNPTLAAGDVVIYKDGVLDGNADNIPVAVGASSMVTHTLSIAEMTADRITVRYHDVAGAEWQDLVVNVHTVTVSQIDDLGTAADLAVVDGVVDAVLVDTIALQVDTAAILADTGPILVDTAEIGVAGVGLTAVPTAVLAAVVENGKTVQDFFRIMKAALAGKSSGGGTATIVFRDDADTKGRITATVDVDGNRTAVVLDAA